jgi:very-short-patch-repair endonuclease
MENKNIFNRKGLKSFRTSLRNRSTSTEAALWEMIKSKNLMEENSEDNTVLEVTLLTSVVLQKSL